MPSEVLLYFDIDIDVVFVLKAGKKLVWPRLGGNRFESERDWLSCFMRERMLCKWSEQKKSF